MEKVTIAELSIDLDSTVKESANLLKALNGLKDSQKQLRAEGKESTAEYAKLDAQVRNASKSYTDQRKVVTALLSTNGDLNKLIQTENKSTTELRNNRNQLIAISQSIKGDTEEEVKLRQQLNNGIDAQTEALRGQSSEFVSGKDSVGEYTQAIEKAIPNNSLLGRSISTVKDVLNVVSPIYKSYSAEINSSLSGIVNAAKGTEGLTKAQKAQVVITNIASNALKLFRIALISTGIGAILVALGSLVAFLGSTQEGIDKVNSVLKPLEVIFGRLFGLLQDFGEAIFKAFQNPQKIIEDLGDKIKENLEVRFNAVIRIFNRIANFDFKGIGEDLVEAGTGVQDLGEKTANFFDNAKQFIQDSIDLGTELANLQVQIEQNENELILRKAELRAEFEKQKEIAQDVSNSQQERVEAARSAVEVQNELLQKEQALLDLKIREKELDNSINDTSREDQKELNELIAQRTEKEAEAARKRVSARNLEKSINKEIAAQQAKRAADAAKAAAEASKEAIDAANLELQIFQEKNATLLSGNQELNEAIVAARVEAEKFIRDESLKIVEDKLNRNLINEREAELERLQIVNDFNEQIAGVNDAFRESEKEKKDKALQETLERNQIEADAEFELKLLQAQTNEERELLQLEKRKERELAAAEELGAATNDIIKRFELERTAIEQNAADARKKIEIDVQNNKLSTLSSAIGQAASLLKETTGVAKVLGIAQATIDTYIGANKALATLPPPFGAITAGVTIATGLANVARIGGVKFAQGGLQEIGGRSHAAGGTKFVGEDGTNFEAEKGELIGVMNKKAARAFMKFNNLFRHGSSRSGYYEGGGVFGSSSRALQSRLSPGQTIISGSQQGIDYDLLANKLASANMQLPPPRLIVDDFHQVNDKVATVESGANV